MGEQLSVKAKHKLGSIVQNCTQMTFHEMVVKQGSLAWLHLG